MRPIQCGAPAARIRERTPAPDDDAERLGVREGTEVLVRRGAMYAGDVPVQIAAGFLPLDVAEGSLLAEDTGPRRLLPPGGPWPRADVLLRGRRRPALRKRRPACRA
ncbi:UTRA domain-containing protein [Actinomadura sp. KC06]|nr:UTRA domain-containing protein [Actinomadura sp. KC06]